MKPLRLIVAAAVLALPLAACVTVFPKADPETLYRFGAQAPQVQTAPGKAFGVLKGRTDFNRAAAGDQILTIDGDQAATVAGARWVSPAAVLFEEAVERAFQGSGGRAQLVTRGEAAKTDYVLGLDVRAFEARYDEGSRAPPTIHVEVRALLTRMADRGLVGERVFTADVRAADNRMSAIVPAFDTATTQVLGELVSWVNASPSP